MPYVPLSIPPGIPQHLQDIVTKQIDPLLADVHAMLRLPMKYPGLEAGCAFPATLTLMIVVAGVSAELYWNPDLDKRTESGERFKRVLVDHFPWRQEPRTGEEILSEKAAEVLYEAYRNPLVHNLGTRPAKYVGEIKIAMSHRKDREIEAIELAQNRPLQWNSTLRLSSDANGDQVHKLTVKCFYWGVRRMILDVLTQQIGTTTTEPRYQPTIDVSAPTGDAITRRFGR